MKIKFSRAAFAALLLAALVLALVSCTSNKADVSLDVTVLGSKYDIASNQTFIRLEVRCVNNTSRHLLTAYSFKLQFYSDDGRLLDTKNCADSDVKLGAGESVTVEWRDRELDEGFLIDGDVVHVKAVPREIDLEYQPPGSSSAFINSDTELSPSRETWGSVVNALGLIITVIAIIAIISAYSNDNGVSLVALVTSVLSLILSASSGFIYGGFASIDIYWIFVAILGVSSVAGAICQLRAFSLDGETVFNCGSIAILMAAIAITALTLLAWVPVFWVAFALSVLLSLISIIIGIID